VTTTQTNKSNEGKGSNMKLSKEIATDSDAIYAFIKKAEAVGHATEVMEICDRWGDTQRTSDAIDALITTGAVEENDVFITTPGYADRQAAILEGLKA
jgi:hypothetical protein